MIKNISVAVAALIFQCAVLPSGSQAYENTPIIYINNTTHIFPTVFEGHELSHAFEVINRGTADLRIKKVTNS